jgi:phytoene dehydrogenase-like protein
MAATDKTLGADDAAWEKRFSKFVRNIDKVLPEILMPPIHLPRHPLLMLSFAIQAIQPARMFATRKFRDNRARSLFSGIAAHSNMPLDQPPTAAFGLLLGMLAHVHGWPIVKGGSQNLSQALASYLESLGGKIETGVRIKSLRELPPARAFFFDLTPKQILNIAFDRLPPSYRWELEKYRYGPGVFKMDWALNAPIPWRYAECLKAATVHVGGSANEIADSERIVARGRHPDQPFVLVAQPSLFDETRAPTGMHTAWAYCHVPNNSKIDMTDRIESQIERFAPGFRDCVVARHVMNTSELETYNANYVGGDITGGVQNILQTFSRPSLRVVPYAMPIEGMFICSSSSPPGGGVHGMCGFHAARAALSTVLYNPPKGGGPS